MEVLRLKLHSQKQNKETNSNPHINKLKEPPCVGVIVSVYVYIFLKKFAKIIDFSKTFIELHSIYFKTSPLLPPKD